MDINGNELRRAVLAEAAAWRALNVQTGNDSNRLGAWLRAEFVGQIGETWPGNRLPDDVLPGWPKQCFHNAGQLVRRRPKTLTYTEGYGMTAQLGMALHHGWAVHRDGRVVNPTWTDAEDTAYLGVRITPEEHRKFTSNDWGSVLDSPDFTPNLALILHRAPDLRDLMNNTEKTWVERYLKVNNITIGG